MKLYTVVCEHTDGSIARMEGLSAYDLEAVVCTFDNLTIVRCEITLDQ